MLANVSLWLHEINDAVRVGPIRENPSIGKRALQPPAAIFVTGLASNGKARLIDALRARLAASHVDVRTGPPSSLEDDRSLHVHAETDVEALIEGGLKASSQQEAQRADLVVPVDWESTDRSVSRVIAALSDRGLADVEAGV